jgi:hypothetical protein
MDVQDAVGDTHLSLMERKPWKNRLGRRLPKRYRDLLPEPISLEPSVSASPSTTSHETFQLSSPSQREVSDIQAVTAGIHVVTSRISQFFTTRRNKFGLFRQYTTATRPSHDPEEHTTAEDLCEECEPASQPHTPLDQFHPYPNRNALLLGDWYWNGGVQKSQAGFKDLLNIVGDPGFDPTDVRHANWDSINHALADDDQWLEEDAGWRKTTVSITVPFQARRNATAKSTDGPQEFLFADFYHRNLVEVIKEKLSNPRDDDLFHYEPYVLNFQPDGSSRPIRVHGELYTSPAFIEAHTALQEMPPEPGCSLSRCVIALMFCSDSTHLTSFGNATLWPLYLYFGNESKYRRCKPSCRLGNHVAYFQKVRASFS